MERHDMTTHPRIAIVGGGPGGLMLARQLQLRGFASVVLERDPHAGHRQQGGSLDLHAETGQDAIRRAGLENAFLAKARPEDQGDRLYDAGGTLLYDHDGVGDNRPEIDRTVLRQLLLDSLAPGTVRWGSKVEAVIPGEDGCHRVIIGGNADTYDIVVGADGAWSRVRPLLSNAHPAYDGVTFVELGFDGGRHPEIDVLVGSGKMFAVGDNRALIAQRNGGRHIRGYAALRISEAAGQDLGTAAPGQLRDKLMAAYAGWSPSLLRLIECGTLLAVRPLYALPVEHGWTPRAGLTLLGDAAHLMSPFGGEGVNLALADAADLADAITSGEGREAVAAYEAAMAKRAAPAAAGAREGLDGALSPIGVASILAHYRERVAG
jgi:2-polyprenyl-6-methoxyphenol hydroxylase-like FAD-dependent oxidoreductase